MISEEIKEKIIDLDYQGISKEKIAKMLKVSKGTVFNVIKEHEREIGKANREAIRRLANNASKNNISFEQIHKGVKINTFLEKNNLSFEEFENICSTGSKLKKETEMMPINVPNDLGAVQTFSFIWNTKEEKVMQLKSLLEESKIKISSLDVKFLFEALRINYSKGFAASCKYILEQPIIVTPKPFPGKNNLIS